MVVSAPGQLVSQGGQVAVVLFPGRAAINMPFQATRGRLSQEPEVASFKVNARASAMVDKVAAAAAMMATVFMMIIW